VRADRGELHQVTKTRLLCPFDKSGLWLDQSLVDRRQQQAPIQASKRAVERLGFVEVGDDEVALALEICGLACILHHRPEGYARLKQCFHDQVPIGSSRSRNQDHLFASLVIVGGRCGC
jgi:hypothetical protein